MKKQVISGVLTASIIVGMTMPIFATNQAKEENIYVNLENNGAIKDIYVVNEFILEQDGTITDYGEYNQIRNLSGSQEMHNENNQITWNGKKGNNYYQGTLKNKDIPWDIQVSYFLDGKEITPKELALKSGNLEIRIGIRQNKNVNSTFFDNYLLQTTLSLKKEQCQNIQAKGATIANVGDSKQLTYNIFAGEEKDISIQADVKDFELEDGISFNGVVMSMAIDSLDTSVINDKVSELRSGITSLNSGASKLRSGSLKYESGIRELASKTKNLPTQSTQVANGINSSLNGVKTIESKITGATSISDSEKQKMIAQITVNIDANLAKDSNYQALKVADPKTAEYIRQMLINTSIQTAQTVLQNCETKTRQSMVELNEGLKTLENGLSTLSTEYGKMNTGLSTVSKSISTLSNSYQNIQSGVNELATGTNTLDNRTKNLQTEVDNNIDEILEKFKNSDYQPVSFVSTQNTNISSVQFVIKTQGIKQEESKKEESNTPVEESFWDKLMKLFQK